MTSKENDTDFGEFALDVTADDEYIKKEKALTKRKSKRTPNLIKEEKTMSDTILPKKRHPVKKPVRKPKRQMKKHRPLSESSQQSQQSQLLSSKGVKKRRPYPQKAINTINTINTTSDFTGNIMSLEVPETEWLVEDLLGTGFLTLAGYGKAGKTTLALQLAYAVKSGSQFLGHPVKKREVYFIQLEMGQGKMKEYAIKQALPQEVLKWKFSTKENRKYLTEENILRDIE